MRIKQTAGSLPSNMLLPNLILLIDVTFSTPTSRLRSLTPTGDSDCYGLLTSICARSRTSSNMPMSLSTRIAAAKRIVRQFEEDRPLFLKRIADRREVQQGLAIKLFEDSLRHAKQKLDVLLAEQGKR